MPTIKNFRLSLVFTEAYDDMLRNPAASTLGFLASAVQYEAAIDGQLGPNPPDLPSNLSFPLQTGAGRSFWSLYLGPSATALHGGKAWRQLIPLRYTLPISITPPSVGLKFMRESLFYPHGVSFILTAECTGSFSLIDAAKLAMDLRRDTKVQVAWPDRTYKNLKLEEIGANALTWLRNMALGNVQPEAPHRPSKPFSVVTVIQGEGAARNVAVADGSPEHRIFEALTGWNPAWENQDPLPLITEHILISDNPSPSNILYARQRGRCVWIPRCFLPRNEPARQMGCYHRNLTLASAHVESLAALCQVAAAADAAGKRPGGTYLDLCRRAGEILGRLYGGSRSTYRSISLRRQVDDNEWVTPINYVRNMCQLPPLS